MPYISNTQEDRAEMLKAIGVEGGDVEQLFKDIPKNLRTLSFNMPSGISEYGVMQRIKKLADKNCVKHISFLGAGYYDHFIPAAIDAIVCRSEFYTAYTPYQPEASQGTLQSIYEYQSVISRLTGMEVANASLYDGATAVFEAVMMAMRITGRARIVVDGSVNPIYRNVLYSLTKNLGVEIKEIPATYAQLGRDVIGKYLDEKTAAVILQNPNFFGTIDDYSDVIEKCHTLGIIAIMSVYPISLGIIKTPGEMNSDIVIGEGQSLGIPLSFGGPYLGFMATKKEFVRKIPGRLVGATTDIEGKRGFVLTLQTREQHIRREKATSNICSNEALCALRSLVYLCLLGKNGIKEVATICFKKAEYAKKVLSRIKGVDIKTDLPTFNEFMVKLPLPAEKIIKGLQDKGFVAGLPLGRYYKEMKNYMLVAVTEKHTKQEIDKYAKALRALLWS
jgi:glycine dehydrogenase subunit 1